MGPPNKLLLLIRVVTKGRRLWICHGYYKYYPWLHSEEIQLNLSTMATLETEESVRCREVLNKSQCLDFLSMGMKKVAVAERWPFCIRIIEHKDLSSCSTSCLLIAYIWQFEILVTALLCLVAS